ncbi:hypothetical protein V7103_08365 [Neobacillus drentensis]|jgi:hypothetical protein|uniref:hypothetical protein n=1 Tax=Neobacillus drentensis TaxID=220684 RepID=UPI0030007589
MYNEFKHLHNGLTVLFCKDTKAKSVVEVYVDTEIYHYISSLKVEWKSWSSTKKKGTVEKFIGGINESNGKAINLRKVIGDYLHGKGKHFTLINENHCDLRQCNIFPFKQGSMNNLSVRKEIAERRKQLQPINQLNKKEDKVTTANSNNVQIIEYGEKILILEDEQVVSELPKVFLNAILKKYQTQTQLALL